MSKIEQWQQEADTLIAKVQKGTWIKKAGHGIQGLEKKKGVKPEEEVTVHFSKRKRDRLNARIFELDKLIGRERRKRK